MKKIVKKALILMSILTVVYFGAVAYAEINLNSYHGTVYAAFEYEGVPTVWYTPQQLGIVKIIEYGNETRRWLHVVVEEPPFPLQEEQPVFKYKNKFWQISPLWVSPGLPEQAFQARLWEIPIGGTLGVGWIFTGVLFLKGRKRE